MTIALIYSRLAGNRRHPTRRRKNCPATQIEDLGRTNFRFLNVGSAAGTARSTARWSITRLATPDTFFAPLPSPALESRKCHGASGCDEFRRDWRNHFRSPA